MSRYLTVQSLIEDVQAVRAALRNDTSLDWSPMRAPEEKTPLPEKPRARAARREKVVERDAGGPSVGLLAGLGIFAVLLVGVFAFVMSTWLFGGPMGAPKEVSVPANLIGLNRAQAEAALTQLGLVPEIREDFHEKPEGVVFDTAPKGGVEMRAGKAVILYVSKGSEPITVPDVVGKQRAEAQQALQAAGLVMGETKEEYSEVYNKGEVISQSPTGASQAKKRSEVHLVVSKGSEPIPDRVDEETPDEPSGDNPQPDNIPQPDLPVREHEVVVSIPRSASGPQTVRIIVRNEDGTENTVYEQEHQPGEEVKQTVSTAGARGKSQIRVQLNGREISRKDV